MRGGHIVFSADPVGVPLRVYVPMIFLEPMGGISPNLHGYLIRISLRADLISVTLTLFLRSQED